MKKIALFTAIAGLTLVSAAPPSHMGHSGRHKQWAGNGYPPCSATVRDRCIQLYERGVATASNLALNERLGPNRPGVGLAAVRPAPVPHAGGGDYEYADRGWEPTPGGYTYADPDEEIMMGDWADEDEYAAWGPEGDYYDEEVSGM